MKALIQNELRESRKQLLIWLGVMLLVIGFCYYEFLSLKDSLSDVAQMLAGFPKLLNIMFGVKGRLDTALGWYSCIYFWTAILAFAYALNLGLSCVAKEIKRGTSAYLFTKPVNRTQIVLAKVAASAVNLLVFSVFCGGVQLCDDRPSGRRTGTAGGGIYNNGWPFPDTAHVFRRRTSDRKPCQKIQIGRTDWNGVLAGLLCGCHHRTVCRFTAFGLLFPFKIFRCV